MRIKHFDKTQATKDILNVVGREEAGKLIWLLANMISSVNDGTLEPKDLPDDPNIVIALAFRNGVMGA